MISIRRDTEKIQGIWNMTIQQLYYALTIAKFGSMNRAAEELFITQPALTNAIKELEKETGITIFLRSKKGVVPTTEGAEFLKRARRVYQQYDLLLDRYRARGDIKQKFSVSTQHYSFATKAFIETVKKFGTLSYEFRILETRTRGVIRDVSLMYSEVGLLYINDFNRKVIQKELNENDLEFHRLIRTRAYVYLWRGHPLSNESFIRYEQLTEYPCLSFEQGVDGSAFFAEEILSENEYARVIKASDRATMLNLMAGLNGYTLCSGIISDQLNGDDFVAIPYEEDAENPNSVMEIGYVTRQQSVLSTVGEVYVQELRRYLNGVDSAGGDGTGI